MLRAVIPTLCGCLVQEIDPGGKRYMCIRAGLNRRKASGIVAAGEGVGVELPVWVTSSMYTEPQTQKIVPQSGNPNHNPNTRTNIMTRLTPRGRCTLHQTHHADNKSPVIRNGQAVQLQLSKFNGLRRCTINSQCRTA